MGFPTLFKHTVVDEALTRKRYCWDRLVTFAAMGIIGVYAVISAMEMTKTTYEGICSNDGISAEILCNEWVHHSCSVYGENYVQAKGVDQGGWRNGIYVTSPTFCDQYEAGEMEGEGVLYTYLMQSGEWGDIATDYNCCGQKEQTPFQKLVVWIGVIGGFVSVIITIARAMPVPPSCLKEEEQIHDQQGNEEEEIQKNQVIPTLQ